MRHNHRLFWAWLARLWSGWPNALAFVQPRTVIWQQQRFRDHWRRLSEQGKPGRPAVAKEIHALIQAMWQTNPTWDSPRIVGELHKLGIDVAKSTVETYQVRPHRSPSPTWKAFLHNHVKDLSPLDFFVVRSIGCSAAAYCRALTDNDVHRLIDQGKLGNVMPRLSDNVAQMTIRSTTFQGTQDAFAEIASFDFEGIKKDLTEKGL